MSPSCLQNEAHNPWNGVGSLNPCPVPSLYPTTSAALLCLCPWCMIHRESLVFFRFCQASRHPQPVFILPPLPLTPYLVHLENSYPSVKAQLTHHPLSLAFLSAPVRFNCFLLCVFVAFEKCVDYSTYHTIFYIYLYILLYIYFCVVPL